MLAFGICTGTDNQRGKIARNESMKKTERGIATTSTTQTDVTNQTATHKGKLQQSRVGNKDYKEINTRTVTQSKKKL